jgi:hypothetical protein
MKGQFFYNQFRNERIAQASTDVTQLELDHVSLAVDQAGEVVESKFQCKVCDADFSKGSCETHMKRYHGLDKAVVRRWLTHKDAILQRNSRQQTYIDFHLRLTRALRALADDEDYSINVGSTLMAHPPI